MKITNEALLIKFAEAQLKKYASRVLMKFTGNTRLVCYEDWYAVNSYLHHSQVNISELSKYQTLKRLRALVGTGDFKCYERSELDFWIDNKQMEVAFIAAREFWLSCDIPTRHSDMLTANPVFIENYDYLLSECENMLLNRFGGSYCVREVV